MPMRALRHPPLQAHSQDVGHPGTGERHDRPPNSTIVTVLCGLPWQRSRREAEVPVRVRHCDATPDAFEWLHQDHLSVRDRRGLQVLPFSHQMSELLKAGRDAIHQTEKAAITVSVGHLEYF
jgi:hypothetical protein